MSTPADAAVRDEALEPTRSFIVQAPAGSGKTELLTRRVLTLLATVDEPEQILAITFTRKAASEMRQRVMSVLTRANAGTAAMNDYEEQGLALARAVLARDEALGWQLLSQPQRLNLRTIDSLALQLAGRMPVVSALGAPMGRTENATALYHEAAERFIDAHLAEMDLLLLQLGNRLERAQTLLAELLGNRDQWKRYVFTDDDSPEALRARLEGMLQALIESRLQALCDLQPAGFGAELPALLRLAAHHIAELTEVPLDELPREQQAWVELQEMPGAAVADLGAWQGLAEALLTRSEGTLRKKADRRIGFPTNANDADVLGTDTASLKSHKARFVAQLAELTAEEAFLSALKAVRDLPDPRYGDVQWALLEQLLNVLPSLLLELQLVFGERHQVDFLEIAERARRALGTDETPTDLALAMDLKLRHILVDEFQDTSQSQFELFSRLVAGWTSGDGRTFLAVGDPMQSIYRFRDGDVTLFGRARDEGIADLRLDALTLSVNFRAAPAVIDWVNATFSEMFPDEADPASGAIPYAPSTAHLTTPGTVEIHPFINRPPIDEADHIAELARLATHESPGHSVAILVRTKKHAKPILAALRRTNLQYHAVNMDLLGERLVVQDLLSLCLALRYPHDRLHWLSVLRSPGCGLTLTDLGVLMQDASADAAVMDLLREPVRQTALSADGQLRVQRFLAIIEPAVERAPRTALMPWVESCWLQLGGPAACADITDLNAAERCIATLHDLEATGELWQKSVLTTAMSGLFAAPAILATHESPDELATHIHVLTLHKAKGLEFDTVIIPALDRIAGADPQQLLNWMESSMDGHPQLLLAPIEERGAVVREPINKLVRTLREQATAQEKLRLLYVACTRARLHLHLTARVSSAKNGVELRQPRANSLLRPLWPIVEPEFLATHTPDDQAPETTQLELILDTHEPESPLAPPLERIEAGWSPPALPHFEWPAGVTLQPPDIARLEFSWAGTAARDVGTVVHRQLQRLAEQPESRASATPAELSPIVRRQLRNAGVPASHLDSACAQVIKALVQTLADERGRWILDPSHSEARSEWALSLAGEPVGIVGGQNDVTASDKSVGGQNRRGDSEKTMGGQNRGEPPLLVGGQNQNQNPQAVVIDRTFVDAAGTRWIVDFKTGDHVGGQKEAFLDREVERYRGQLNRYADIIRRFDDRPIRVGLYFPLLQGWREWAPG